MSLPPETARTLDAYVALFAELTPERLDEFRALCIDDVRFVDPFNDVTGIERFIGIFRHMYATVDAPRFEIVDHVLGERAAYVRWRFIGRPKRAPRDLVLEGMSEVCFAEDGRVRAHVDHWDAASQLYARLPIIGPLMRWLARRLSADT